LAAFFINGSISAQTSCAPVPAGLVGWWAGEGNANDNAGTNNGVLQGAVTFVPGEVGLAFSLDGTTADVHIPGSAALNVGAGSGMTVEAWINPADVTAQHPLVEWNSGSFGAYLWLATMPPFGGGAGALVGSLKDTSFQNHAISSAGELVVTNVWQHVAMTYDKTTGIAVLYLDGTVVQEQTLGVFTPLTTGDLWLGLRPYDGGAGLRYAGLMDEVSVYDRALSAGEVLGIYSAGRAGKCVAPIPPSLTNGLVAYYPLTDDGRDRSGHGLDLTLSNVLFSAVGTVGGAVRQAASFDGQSSYGIVNQTWITGLTNWTWSAWLYSPRSGNANPPLQSIYMEGRQGGNCSAIGILDEMLVASAYNAGWPNNWMMASVPDVLTDGWNHVALTLANGGVGTGTLSIFFNGVLTNTGVFQAVDAGDTLPRIGVVGNGWALGNPNNETAPWKGSMADLRFYNRALSSAEVQQLYALGAAVNPTLQPALVNIDVGAAAPIEVGFAATGLSANDYWNSLYAPWQSFASLSNLKAADGTPTPIGMTVQNGAGDWYFNYPGVDVMYSTYCYAQDLGNVTVTLTNLPGGQYDFYLYGHAGADNANTVFELRVGGNDYGLQSTATNSDWRLTHWVEGAQYVVYRGVALTNGGASVTIIAHPGLSGYTQVNGLQIARSGASAPSITLQPSSQAVALGANVTFSVVAAGAAPLSYQWRFGGSPLGATNASLTLTNVGFANAGAYSVIISNSAGTVTSSTAVLTVTYPPALVEAANASGVGSRSVTVPILLVANGNENALAFTLDFDPAMLTYAGIVPGGGATAAALVSNAGQAANGLLSVGVALPANAVFTPGTQEVAQVNFTLAFLTNAASTTVGFGNQVTKSQVVDANANPLPANFAAGLVTVAPTPIAGDVWPRPNGDETVTVADWVLEGRYVAGLDYPTNASEFQRADCAPRATGGDGAVTIIDWVQVGRYMAGLDPRTPAGTNSGSLSGPTGMVAQKHPPSGPVKNDQSRRLQVQSAVILQGQSGKVSVNLEAVGDENALGFSLSFDPAVLTYTGFSAGSSLSSANAATLIVNDKQAASGRLGIVLGLRMGANFPSGNQEVVTINFSTPSSASGSYPVGLTSQPVARQVSDALASPLTVEAINGTVLISQPPTLSITLSGQAIQLSWPLWASNFVLQQVTGRLSPAMSWSSLATAPAQTTNATVLALPPSTTNRFYRLRQQ
jgi:hypothetical protein